MLSGDWSGTSLTLAAAEAESAGDRLDLGELAAELAGIAARISAMADRRRLPPDRGFTAPQIRTLLQARH